MPPVVKMEEIILNPVIEMLDSDLTFEEKARKIQEMMSLDFIRAMGFVQGYL